MQMITAGPLHYCLQKKKILCYILCAFAGFFYLLLFSFSCSAFRVTIHVLKFDPSNVCMKTYK